MQREAILARVNGDGREAELGGGAHDANGDFAAIRDEEPFDGADFGEWIHF
jgi:hypothetical protein